VKTHVEPPDEKFLVACGKRLELAPDKGGSRLLKLAGAAYGEACKACRTGYLVNLKTEKFRLAEKRLREYLQGRE
jgi:hypothetical protein